MDTTEQNTATVEGEQLTESTTSSCPTATEPTVAVTEGVVPETNSNQIPSLPETKESTPGKVDANTTQNVNPTPQPQETIPMDTKEEDKTIEQMKGAELERKAKIAQLFMDEIKASVLLDLSSELSVKELQAVSGILEDTTQVLKSSDQTDVVLNGASQESSSEDIIRQLKLHNQELRATLTKVTSILRDKTGLCLSQDRKLGALGKQVESLKEVVRITKDMLGIRNLEVHHLTLDMVKMEERIESERNRHNEMVAKMEQAVQLNTQLKVEYETQLAIFKELKEKYELKVEKLLLENARMQQNL